ncbi:MAG: M14 family zinc carboxypeptidase, partial [Clostridium sp.]|uniref:M14 family zinc carboxypeptidase n=1 Tax=Clostridium sp. TaxID=1506 RepID=UPI003EE452DA
MEKQREEKMETRVKPGEFVPNGFSYPNNATVQNDFLYLRDENGNIIPGKVTVGDRITVLKVLENKKLALVQYPVGTDVKEGYVTNATNIIKYDNLEKWVNKGSRTNIYEDANTGSQRLGSVDPNEKATFLYRKNNMDNIVYNASGGTRNKSGFADLNGSSGGSGSNGVDPWPSVAPGSMVSGGFTFPNNAKVIGGSLQLKDANGNNVSGTVTSGDSITVLDVGHSKQLTLVQYPAGGGVKQGYVSNNTNLIKYNNEYDWYNGASEEYVYSKYNSSDSGFGKLAKRESATKLYEYGGRVHIAYDTSKGMLTKSGYVNYKGRTVPARQHLDLGAIGHKNARLKVYGKSGNGYNLNAYKLGATDQSGKKIKKLFLGFAIHGWEDHWRFDGEALVKIGSSVLNKLGNYISTNGDLNGWQVCIAPCMNPDGLIAGRTSYGPGRCTVTTKIDLNRCFPTGFSASSEPRYYTGSSSLGAPEAVALRNLVTELSNESSELMVVDCHGWLGLTQGNGDVGKYFTKQ